MRFLFLLVTLYIFGADVLYAQVESDIDLAIRDLLEDMAIDGRLSESGEEAQVLQELSDKKIDINSASADELRSIHVLTESQVQSIIYERSRLGSFNSVLDLLLLPEFDEWFVSRLAHFIKYEDEAEKKKSLFLKGDFLSRITILSPKPIGFTHDVKSPYLGAPLKLLSRNKLTVNDVWTVGVVGESDLGEPISSHGISLTDFTSAFVSYRKNGNGITRAVIGHYNAHVGQGLGLWSGFAANQTSVQASLDRSVEAISPSLSASEANFLRGAACTIVHNRSYLTLFGSLTDNDASVIEVDTADIFIQSIQTDGYHRTQSELSGRNNVSVQLCGVYAVQGFEMGKVGIGLNRWSSSKALYNEDKIYRINYPDVDNITTYHADYRLIFPRVKFYGEAALQKTNDNALALMSAVDFALSGGSYVSLAYRDFSRKYYAVVQNPYSRWTQPSGERGLYIGLQISPIRNLSLLTNVNMYSNRWLTYRCNVPSDGHKIQIKATYSPTQNSQIFLRLRVDNNDATLSSKNYIKQLEHRVSYKVQYQIMPLPVIRFKGAAEFIHHRIGDGSTSSGLWLSQEVKVELERWRLLRATLFLAHFDTDDYNSRVYAYLPDVLYSMSTPSFSGRGVLAIGQLSINPVNNFSVDVRIKALRYLDRDVIGTGNEQTHGPKRTELKLQLRYKLFHRMR